MSERVREIFENNESLSQKHKFCKGLDTGDNEQFLRFWFEIGFKNISLNSQEEQYCTGKWVHFAKGGEFRRWYGNRDYLINWFDGGREIKNSENSNIRNEKFYFQEGVTWSALSSGKSSFRLISNSIFGSGGYFLSSSKPKKNLLELNSSLNTLFLSILSPTLNYEVGQLSLLPELNIDVNISPDKLIHLSQTDWDSYERSWDFKTLPLIDTYKNTEKAPLTETYKTLRSKWQSMTDEMKKLEEENNKIFIEAYGLEEELTAEVPLKEITLTCNPHYRYDSKKSSAALEKLLLEDTIKEFISYAVGCMFGRYSLDKAGLILANQGETLNDYLKAVPEPSFMPDEDNVIPILEEEWFNDDIVNRFKNFLKVSLGEENYELNLSFIEEALGKDIRKYFMNDFYDHHVKQYKKRPIYWMFSSPKASFNVLIYMHRYNENTINIVLNEYLRHYREKLTNLLLELENISNSESKAAREKIQAVKDIDKTKKILKELSDYEQAVLFPLATEKIKIDLDDGVKINYNKFTGAVQKISGLTE